MNKVPEELKYLLDDKTRALAYLATTMPDGSPQVTPVWFNISGEYVLVNTAQGRVKERNMQARPQVALAIAHPKDPYRYLQIRGRVVESTTEGGRAHIDDLAKKYTGQEKFDGPPDQVRVIFKIAVESAS